MRWIILSLLSGCSHYVGYTHLSDPRIANDGYNLVCLGSQAEMVLTIDAAVCGNASPNRGEFVKVDIRYIW